MAPTKDLGFVKLAIEKEGQLPLLTTFDQSRPLSDILREVCANWSLPDFEHYSLQYSDYNSYITEENRQEIKNGAVLKLTLSPAKLADTVFQRLHSSNPEEKCQALIQLASISEDAAFAQEFKMKNGLGVLVQMVESKTDNPENMANTLTAFQELMEHGEDLWDQIVTHRFIKNLTQFVNRQTTVDPTVLKRCLAILESIVTNSAQLYSTVANEIMYEQLVLHLQNPNQEIQLNAIALTNSLFHKSPPKSNRQFAEKLARIGFRTVLLTNVVRGTKGVRDEMAHQLYVYQALHFRLLEDKLMTCGNPNNQNLIENLDILRKKAFESDVVSSATSRPLSQAGNLQRDFKRLGFTDVYSPVSDFQETPPGLLPLHNMMFFAKNHQDQFLKVVLDNLSRVDDYECPFARSSIALTKMLCEILKINCEPPSESSLEYHPIFFTTDFAFEEFYCICIQLVSKTWREMKATASGDFNRVMAVVKEQIVRALGDTKKLPTMDLFKNRVFNLGFSEILKLMQQEFHQRNMLELKAKPVVELRAQIVPELREIVRQQRLEQLIDGQIFDKAPGKTRARDKFWYCRLSPNLKFLHYGDCEEEAARTPPQLEALPNKLPIADVKSLAVGKDSLLSKQKNKRVNVQLCFSLVYDRDSHSSEEQVHLDFIAPSEQVFVVWIDALSTLLNKQMPSKESKEDLETLLNMEMKLRLLDLEGISIPDIPPTLPPQPPNYNFVYNFH